MEKLYKTFFLILSFVNLIFIGCNLNNNPQNEQKYKYADIEYDYSGINSDYDRWDVDANNGTYTSAYVSIRKGSTVDQISYEYFYFDGTYYDMVGQLKTARESHRTYQDADYPYYLDLSWYNYVSGDPRPTSNIGISDNKAYDPGYDNLSFIFYDNITIEYPHTTDGPDWNWQSVINYVSAHELIHQIGNVWGPDAHSTHDGQNPTQCVLNPPGNDPNNPDSRFTELTTSYHVCPRHVDKLSKGTDLKNQSIFEENNDLKSNNTSKLFGNAASEDNKGLSISLEKEKFTKYEPILVQFRFINESKIIDTIYDNFDPFCDEMRFHLINNNGDTINENHHLELTKARKPTYILLKADTIISSMVLTEFYGNCLKKNEVYFPLSISYLEPGEYQLETQTNINGKDYISNKVTFQVAELSKQDEEVLELLKAKEYDKIFAQYPENSLTKHALAWYVYDFNINYIQYPINISSDSIINFYKNFFDKYPNSFYNSDMSFILSFFNKLAAKENVSQAFVNSKLDEFIENYKGSVLSDFLNNKYIKNIIIKSSSNIKKDIEMYNKIKK